MRLPLPPLLVITDRLQARRPLEDVAAACFAGGCRWLSLREKDLSAADRLDLLRRLVALGRRFGATIGIHDDIDAALAVECGAVHLPEGASILQARARLGGSIVLGVSAHDEAGVAAATRDGADYATFSPIFPTVSKPGYGPSLGLDMLSHAAARAKLPLVALGGIDATVVAPVIAAGASGIAAMGEAMRAADPERTVAALVAALAAALRHGHSPDDSAGKGMPP